MNLTVGTVTAVAVPVPGDAPAVVQNLGPGIVYVDGNSAVTTATGLKILVGATVTINSPSSIGALYVISDTTATSVRYLG